MQRIFISDLHLQEEKSYLTEAFRDFLAREVPNDAELYILGDLFNYWVGDGEISDYHRMIASLIASAGSARYFMPGNRDFLIGRRYARLAGMKILRDESAISTAAGPVALCHGDSLCTLDEGYQKFRRFRLSPFNRFVYSLLPSKIKHRLAGRVRDNASREKSEKSDAMMDVTPDAVKRLMGRFDSRILIHGHTHKPQEHRRDGLVRYVLGDWRPDGYEYVTETDGRFEFVSRSLQPREAEDNNS
ncbi:MAG: UDP-2,3-diacylglucosamine diphosphatase [Succinivibrionaceae bacterium]|nr:UDP-2,3-diacylglucosamine diphosphatase [Succinivibrionaceae bacterium]